MLTLLKSVLEYSTSPTRVLLPALESMESKRYTHAIEAIQRTFTNKITEVLKPLGMTARIQIVLSAETP